MKYIKILGGYYKFIYTKKINYESEEIENGK